MKIINCWTTTSSRGITNPGDIVVIYNDKGSKKMKVIQDYPWYFYTEKSSRAEEILKDLKMKGSIKSFVEGRKYIRVYVEKKKFRDENILSLVGALHSSGIKTYEADVGPSKRFLLDKDLPLEDYNNLNVAFFDIETDDSSGKIEYMEKNGFKTIDAQYPILSFAAVDRKGNEFFLHDPNEKTLLEKINQFLIKEQIDMLVGWNSKDFDIPYIAQRMDKHKLSSSYIRNILHEDLMGRVQYFYSKDPEARQTIKSYSLNSISKYFLNETKIERDGKVIDLMKENFEMFREYNIQDCRLVKKLEDKLGLINLTYQMFQICQCTAQNWSMVKALDNFILAEGNRQGIHYPTNENYLKTMTMKDEEEEPQYLGAFVLDPVAGYYEKVYDLDFKSLYPNIIRTFNISPDSRLDKMEGLDLIETPGVEIDGVIRGKCYFDDTQEGVVPKKIKLLLDEREKIRKEQKKFSKDSQEWRDLNVKQLVVKELANSVYGVIGNKYFRAFNLDLAESITATGQYLIRWLQTYFSNDGRIAIYGDTDSIFIKIKNGESIDEVLRCCNRDLEKHLRKAFHIKECTIELALDKIFDKFLITSKKKYVGVAEGKTKYVGMECIKRDNPDISNQYQRELIDIIFKHSPIARVKGFIGGIKHEILNMKIDPQRLVINKKMGKDADLYKGKSDKKYTPPIQVRIVKEMKNKKGDKTDLSKGGSIIQFIYTNGSTDAVHISEFKGEFDRKHYWNKLVYPQLERILRVTHSSVDWMEYYETDIKHAKNTAKTAKRPSKRSLLQKVLPKA
jgi:DNA polymerase elongation subunit (family B)